MTAAKRKEDEPQFERRKVQVPEIVSAKWSAEVVDEGFVPFPKKLLRCMKALFADKEKYAVADLQVILAVVDYQRPNLLMPPSYDFLAFTAGMPVEQFKKRVGGLVKRNWLTVEGDGDRNVTISLAPLLKKIVALSEEEE